MVARNIFRNAKLQLTCVLIITCFCSCKKLIEVGAPKTSINNENVYKTDFTAIAAVTSIYASMSNYSESPGFTGSGSLSLLAGLSADELTLYSGVTDGRLVAFFKNSLISTPAQNYGSEFWPVLYNYIFQCNAAIEGLNASGTLTPSVKQQLLGEAKFMRAFFYFYLAELYQNVPLTTTTDPAANVATPQSPLMDVFNQVIKDLIEAQALLSTDYLNANLIKYSGATERIRPTKWAATALLARVYLYNQDYTNAEIQATAVIDQNNKFALTPLSDVFLKNSQEAIWQLQPVKTGRNTEDAFTFILPPTGPTASAALNPVYLSNSLLNNIENNDQRKSVWIGSVTNSGITYFYPYKYKATNSSGSVSEYLMMLRLAEQFLIRAESRAQLNKISAAKDDLNVIRTRAGLPNTSANDQPSFLSAILHERQVELFAELGQRWFDLKRTNSVNPVMNIVTPTKGGSWNNDWQLYPIPFADIQRNPHLMQNPGY